MTRIRDLSSRVFQRHNDVHNTMPITREEPTICVSLVIRRVYGKEGAHEENGREGRREGGKEGGSTGGWEKRWEYRST